MTTHAAPTITACCRLPVDALPDDDRVSGDPGKVTCRMGEADGVAALLARQIRARNPDRPPEWVAAHLGGWTASDVIRVTR